MDPEETLLRIRRLVKELRSCEALALPNNTAALALELAEAIEAMDGWLSNGGFKPIAWQLTDQQSRFKELA